MKEIGDIASAESRLLEQLKELFSHIRVAGQAEPSSLKVGLEMLKSLRCLAYEDMNQLQHEALILEAAKLLQADFCQTIAVRWLWNPRQGGSGDEPDLRGLDDQGHVVVSAEVTTSQRPKGLIDTKITKTLKKLSGMAGDKYYVVTTEEMEKRARSKLSSLGCQINILRL